MPQPVAPGFQPAAQPSVNPSAKREKRADRPHDGNASPVATLQDEDESDERKQRAGRRTEDGTVAAPTLTEHSPEKVIGRILYRHQRQKERKENEQRTEDGEPGKEMVPHRQQPEAQIVHRPAAHHHVEEPIRADRRDEQLRGKCSRRQFCDSAAHGQVKGKHRKTHHHDQIRHKDAPKVAGKLAGRLLNVGQIARNDQERRHHKRQNARLCCGIEVAEADNMNEHDQQDKHCTREVKLVILFH